MKQFVAIIALIICSATTAAAQSFTERLQKKGRNQATITIHHDAAIDELVNGQAWKRIAKPAANTTPAPSGKTATGSNKATTTDNKPAVSETVETEYSEMQMQPKKTYKVNGYRVQVFAGGNSRADRQKAQRTGNAIKVNFPEESVYVNFFSPRWICRVGNYHSYEEAHQMLIAVKQLGYQQATIVKGKITVQF